MARETKARFVSFSAVLSGVKEIRGVGLWVGVEIHASSGKARPFCERLLERGVLCKETHDQVIRFAPPLVVTREDLGFLLQQARAVLAS